ncbi:MAG: acetylglutamate kinase, partial [Bacteroidales bacterium]|nr:acetylglutamate kinase [Bacteroidales bacterium]
MHILQKIIKIGGNVVDNPELLEKFIIDFAAMDGPKILVHGGGVMASQLQKELGRQPVMV